LLMLSQVFPALQVPVQIGGSPPEKQTQDKPSSNPPLGGSSVRALCPIDFKFDKTHRTEDGIWGLQRVSRHASLWAFGLIGFGTALGTPFATEFVMFATPLLFAAVGSSHQDYRYRRGSGGQLTPEMESKTSNVPFVAIVQGRQSMSAVWAESKGLNALLALLLGVGLAVGRARRGR
jgi:uncharacterized membrane protein